MSVEFSAFSDVGRVRTNNEDAIALDSQRALVVLADGMGGYNAGEVASAMAVDSISGELANWLDENRAAASMRDVRRAMEICADNANRAIFEAANSHPDYAGMGTTLVIALLHGAALVVGHVGDSRAYRWRAGALVQLTRDHSLLQEQVDIGLLTPEEAAASANRSLVTRALGVEDTVLLDVQELPVEPGDVYLLCSDGLNDMVSDPEIAAVLASPEPLDDLSRRLIDLANQAGGRDNVSVALIRMSKTFKKYGTLSKLLRK